MKNNVNYNAELGKALVQDSQGNHLCSHTQNAMPTSTSSNVRIGNALYLPPPKVAKKPRIFASKPAEPDTITYDVLFAVLKDGYWQIWLARGEKAPEQIGAMPLYPQYPTWFYSNGGGSGTALWNGADKVTLTVSDPSTFTNLYCTGVAWVFTGISSPVIPTGFIQQFIAVTTPETAESEIVANLRKVWDRRLDDWRLTINWFPWRHPFLGDNSDNFTHAFSIRGEVPPLGSSELTVQYAPVFGILSANNFKAWPWITSIYSSWYDGAAYIKPWYMPRAFYQGLEELELITDVTQLCDAILPSTLSRQPLNWRDAAAIHVLSETPPSRHTPAEIADPLLNFDKRGAYFCKLFGLWKEDLKTGDVLGVVELYAYDFDTNTYGELLETVEFTFPQINPANYGVDAEKLEILGISAYTK